MEYFEFKLPVGRAKEDALQQLMVNIDKGFKCIEWELIKRVF